MRIEVTSNHFLRGKDKLNRRQIAWLGAQGWNTPTGNRKKATPEKDPNGSPNYFIDLQAPYDPEDIARRVVDSMVNGLQIENSSSLAYKAFDKSGKAIQIEELGLVRATSDGARTMDRLLEVFRRVTGIADLGFDEDGDISVTREGVSIWTTLVDGKVRLSALLLGEMDETPAILRRLNELNRGSHGFRCAIHNGRIYASTDLRAVPFIPEHFETGIDEFAGTTVRIASLLRDEFSWGFFTNTGAKPNLIQ
jgi:hypothetical protein